MQDGAFSASGSVFEQSTLKSVAKVSFFHLVLGYISLLVWGDLMDHIWFVGILVDVVGHVHIVSVEFG